MGRLVLVAPRAIGLVVPPMGGLFSFPLIGLLTLLTLLLEDILRAIFDCKTGALAERLLVIAFSEYSRTLSALTLSSFSI